MLRVRVGLIRTIRVTDRVLRSKTCPIHHFTHAPPNSEIAWEPKTDGDSLLRRDPPGLRANCSPGGTFLTERDMKINLFHTGIMLALGALISWSPAQAQYRTPAPTPQFLPPIQTAQYEQAERPVFQN